LPDEFAKFGVRRLTIRAKMPWSSKAVERWDCEPDSVGSKIIMVQVCFDDRLI